GTIDGNLTKVSGSGSVNPQLGSLWPSFRGNAENNGITAAKSPTTADKAQLYWAVSEGGSWSGAPSSPIFVGEDLVFTTKSEIVKINRVTGKTIKKNTMISRSAFSLVPPTYANGMIFVALGGGRVQAFNAETLESLWVYQDPLGGQPDSPILYHDGYVYTGFWNSEKDNANYVAILADDEHPQEQTERKEAAWTHTHKGGFYWAGAIAASGAIIVGSENGQEKESVSTGVLYAFHPTSGKILDQITDIDGDIRSSIVFDQTTGKYHFVSRGGSFYSIKINSDGTFDRGSLQQITLGGCATSTPVIYNGRAYIGVSGSNSLGAYSGHRITVIDLNGGKIAYQVPTRGYPQASGLLSTGYVEEDGYTYVYFIENYSPGIMRVIKDKPGQTQAILSEVNCGILGEREADDYKDYADTLFTPRGEQANYAIGSPIVDEYGTMYFKNDSSYIMALGSKIESIEVTKRPAKTEYKAGEVFDPTGMEVIAHLANGLTRDVTAYVQVPAKALTAYDLEVEITYPYVKYNDKEKKCDQPSTYVPVASITVEEVDKIQNVIDLINQIKDSPNPEAAAARARADYDGLGTKLQKYVPNEDVLIDYELSFAEANITKGAPNGMTVTVTVESYNSLKLTWNRHDYASGYEIYRSTAAGERGSLIKTISDRETTTLVNSGVTAGMTYYYTVRPYILVDGTKIGSMYSNQTAGSTTITAPVIHMEKTGFDSVQLSWQPVSGASGYYLYRNDGRGYQKYKTFVKGTDTSFEDNGLECGKTYQYKVTAWRGESESDFSSEASVSIVLEKV
ncbi:MAG: PQQ-binding-like beta-propeller repeat protein, partial [Firmicutes bacterium]|nr:PQQ-binding-like beta-propeller repeat protein [Bacillota bacterium]